MSALPLVLACCAGALADALASGPSLPDGIVLDIVTPPVEEMFGRMLREEAYDVAEMSLSSFVSSLARPGRPFVALPVFPLRRPVHACLYVSARSGLRHARELAGRRLAAPDYAMTAAVWMRGILADEHGVGAGDVEHWIGGLEQPRPVASPSLNPPAVWPVHRLADGQTLAAQIADGAIDALISPAPPSTLASRPADVVRLFDDHAEGSRLPVPMHVMVMRRSLLTRWPGIAAALFALLLDARRRAGDASWELDGVEANRVALQSFLRYHHEQGLTPATLRVDDLFA